MTPNDVELVQSSFRKILPIADQAAALFYARLFELEPALRAEFPGDIEEETGKLMSLVTAVVASLQRIETLVPTIRSVRGHAQRCCAREEHYASVGAALLWTLQKGLGPEFTPAVSAAWTTTYSLVATILSEAQSSPQAA